MKTLIIQESGGSESSLLHRLMSIVANKPRIYHMNVEGRGVLTTSSKQVVLNLSVLNNDLLQMLWDFVENNRDQDSSESILVGFKKEEELDIDEHIMFTPSVCGDKKAFVLSITR